MFWRKKENKKNDLRVKRIESDEVKAESLFASLKDSKSVWKFIDTIFDSDVKKEIHTTNFYKERFLLATAIFLVKEIGNDDEQSFITVSKILRAALEDDFKTRRYSEKYDVSETILDNIINEHRKQYGNTLAVANYDNYHEYRSKYDHYSNDYIWDCVSRISIYLESDSLRPLSVCEKKRKPLQSRENNLDLSPEELMDIASENYSVDTVICPDIEGCEFDALSAETSKGSEPTSKMSTPEEFIMKAIQNLETIINEKTIANLTDTELYREIHGIRRLIHSIDIGISSIKQLYGINHYLSCNTLIPTEQDKLTLIKAGLHLELFLYDSKDIIALAALKKHNEKYSHIPLSEENIKNLMGRNNPEITEQLYSLIECVPFFMENPSVETKRNLCKKWYLEELLEDEDEEVRTTMQKHKEMINIHLEAISKLLGENSTVTVSKTKIQLKRILMGCNVSSCSPCPKNIGNSKCCPELENNLAFLKRNRFINIVETCWGTYDLSIVKIKE